MVNRHHQQQSHPIHFRILNGQQDTCNWYTIGILIGIQNDTFRKHNIYCIILSYIL